MQTECRWSFTLSASEPQQCSLAIYFPPQHPFCLIERLRASCQDGGWWRSELPSTRARARRLISQIKSRSHSFCGGFPNAAVAKETAWMDSHAGLPSVLNLSHQLLPTAVPPSFSHTHTHARTHTHTVWFLPFLCADPLKAGATGSREYGALSLIGQRANIIVY